MIGTGIVHSAYSECWIQMLRGVLHFHPAKNASNKTKSLAVTVLRNMGDEDVYTKTTSLLAHSFSSRPKLPSLKYWLLGWSDHL